MSQGKRWCFTINNPTASDNFWDNPEILNKFSYIVLQEERGEQGTLHIQGYLILIKKQRMNWLKNHVNNRAHWEIARGTPKESSDYCKKDDTYTGGLRFEHGELPKAGRGLTRDERREKAADELDIIKEGYKRPDEIDSMTLMECGFIPAFKELTSDILGPYRPNLQIITMVGPPATGKSFAIQKFFPDHGLCMPGNSGVWFQRPTSKCMVFEEFKGQIPLQRMLKLLDPYPYALEIKGGMRPAMYETVIITSNTSPRFWYTNKDDDGGKQMDAIHALWDRIGYSDGTYVPSRTCGHYFEAPCMMDFFGASAQSYIQNCRDYFWRALSSFVEPEHDVIGDGDDAG